jgi:xylulokinase
MSLLAIDVGTSGCKAAVYAADGTARALAYAEYPLLMPKPGWAELDPHHVWERVCHVVRSAVTQAGGADPVQALAVSSLGEACVPVTRNRRIVGSSILCVDERGDEFLPALRDRLGAAAVYRETGQLLTNHYGLTKLLWLQRHRPEQLAVADYVLPWGSFVAYMLGGEPVVDHSLACRLLCYDIDRRHWSDDVLSAAGFPADKLPATAGAATPAGTVSDAVAADLGLPRGVRIIVGCHDQCAAAVGCGVVGPGPAACGMGTFFCLTPVFAERRAPENMLAGGLSTEPHAIAGQYVTFVYNQGGVLLRWFRDTFAAAEHRAAQAAGQDVYPTLLAEMPDEPSDVLVLPHFASTGPPEFVTATSGVLAGVRLGTTRGEICKAVLEGVVFYLRAAMAALPDSGIRVDEVRASGGGSRSDAWLRICANILNRPFTRVADSEAGLRGAAVLAGVGSGAYADVAEGVAAQVRLGETFAPRAAQVARYDERYEHYRRLWPLLREYLADLAEARA